jgi:hypothetical protein
VALRFSAGIGARSIVTPRLAESLSTSLTVLSEVWVPRVGQNFHEVFGKPLLPPISILTATKAEELAGALIVDRDQLIVAVLETNDCRVWLFVTLCTRKMITETGRIS